MFSAILMMLMTLGLGIFNGGSGASREVVNAIMMPLISIPLILLIWVAFGYSIAFSSGKSFIFKYKLNSSYFLMVGNPVFGYFDWAGISKCTGLYYQSHLYPLI